MYILIWNTILSLLILTSQSLFHSAIIHLRSQNLKKLIYTQVCTSFIKVRSVKRYGVKNSRLTSICLPLDCVALQFCCKSSKITDRISFILAIFKISFNFFNSFWPTVRIQYDPISHYSSPHLNFSFFAVVINSVLRSSQLENVTKNNKMPNVEYKSKVVFSSASIQNKGRTEISNRGPKQMRRSITLRYYCW